MKDYRTWWDKGSSVWIELVLSFPVLNYERIDAPNKNLCREQLWAEREGLA